MDTLNSHENRRMRNPMCVALDIHDTMNAVQKQSLLAGFALYCLKASFLFAVVMGAAFLFDPHFAFKGLAGLYLVVTTLHDVSRAIIALVVLAFCIGLLRSAVLSPREWRRTRAEHIQRKTENQSALEQFRRDLEEAGAARQSS